MRFGRFAPLLPVLAGLLFAATPSCDGGGGDKGPSSIDELDVDETIDLPSLSGPVDVVRDELGRPHVYATTPEDLARVTGWLHASDRFIQMDLQRRFANGTLAELVGAVLPQAVQQDVLSRAIGLRRAAQATYDALPAGGEEKAMLDAYAEGVNAWIASRGGVRPTADYDLFSYPFTATPAWTAVDSLAIGRLLSLQLAFDDQFDLILQERYDAAVAAFPALDPREGFVDDVVLRVEPPVEYSIVDPALPNAAAAGAPSARKRPSSSVALSPAAREQAKAFLASVRSSPFNPLRDASYGSNNWVVSGDRTRSGHPILANDPHLSLELPPIWYELHLNTARSGVDPNPIDVIGVSLPGVPVIIIGANGKLAWGVTNVGPDATDLYVETYSALDTNGGMAVMWDDDGAGANPPAPVALIADDEPIVLRTGLSTTSAVPNVVYRIPHRNGGNAAIIPGTMTVGTNGTALSWSWTGFEPSGEVLTLMALARAQSGADLETAVDDWDVPPQNFVYADDQGNIGYVANGYYPVRDDDDGDPWTDPPFFPRPGHTGQHEWIGRVARADVPQEQNPARGWIATANQDPLGHTYDNDPLNDDVYIGFAYDNGFRGYRIDTVLEADDEITPRDMMDLQGDATSNLGERFLPFLLDAIGTTHTAEAALLQDWADRGFYAASGVGDDVPASEVDDAAATSLFNVWLAHVAELAFGDELDAAGFSIGSQETTRGLLYLLERPTEAATYDAGAGESVLWDDLTTGPVETQAEIFQQAMTAAIAWLSGPNGFGSADPTDWRWGLLHYRVLPRQSSLPQTDLPGNGNPDWPLGFYPRHGDLFAVDVQNYGFGGALNGDYANEGGGGPSMRLVIEMVPGDMTIWNVLPGGSSGDPESAHYGDQAGAHARNEYFRTWWKEKDVARNAESRVVFE